MFLGQKSPSPSQTPAHSVQALNKIASGVSKWAQKSAMPIGPKDLMHGTLMRFDSKGSGRISAENFQSALREVRCRNVGQDDIARLVNWYDVDASRTIPYNKLISDAFAGMSVSLSLPALTSGRTSGRAGKTMIMAEKARIERRLKELSGMEKAMK